MGHRSKLFMGWLRAVGVSVSLAMATMTASAWDGAVGGKVVAFEITHGANYGFRVYLNAGVAMCPGGPTWAFLNETDSNYKVYVANLMLAKAQGSQVTVYSNLEGAYCRIGHLHVGN